MDGLTVIELTFPFFAIGKYCHVRRRLGSTMPNWFLLSHFVAFMVRLWVPDNFHGVLFIRAGAEAMFTIVVCTNLKICQRELLSNPEYNLEFRRRISDPETPIPDPLHPIDSCLRNIIGFQVIQLFVLATHLVNFVPLISRGF